MLRNYFRIALRNLWRHKLVAGINILGLATGIACCLLIALFVFHEISYDRFHKNADRIVRATMELSYNGNLTKVAATGTRVLPEFKRMFPEVESGVRTYPINAVIKYGDKIFQEKGFVYTDPAFFAIFSFKLLKGNAAEVLNKPNQVVLTEAIARKYFGAEDPVGKILRVNNDKEYIVAGVSENCPENSQIRFDMLASWSSLTGPLYQNESWMDASYYTYLLLKKPGMHTVLEEKIAGYFKAQNENYGVAGKNYLHIRVQPMKDVHLKAVVEGGMEPGGDYRYIYIFSVVALMILVIACANYINLTTARASDRAKEVGVRKVIGASRTQLFSQFMGESVIMVLISLLIGLVLVVLLLPAFNQMADKHFAIDALLSPGPVLTIGVILLSIGFLGSIYPALVLSGFNPVRTLKGNTKTISSGIRLRQSLIVVQFFISTGLILGSLVIHSQLEFIQHKKLGYDNDHVLVLRLPGSPREKVTVLKSELSGSPSILGITTCNQTPTFVPSKYNLSLNNQEMLITGVRTDKDFIKTMGLQLSVGSDFTKGEEEAAFAVTDTVLRPAIVNEAAIRNFGWEPAEAVGKTIKFQGRNTIIKGVVKDFHFSSMHEPISPFIIFLSSNTSRVLVKLSGQQLPQALQYVRNKWSKLAPDLPFDYEFLDDQFNKLYSTETRTGRISWSFAMLAIALASLGILGLVTFTAQQRAKEVSIRKVLGASLLNIVVLLSKDFLKLLSMATIIALPIAWWLINDWLEDFAYRVTISWWMFLVAGIAGVIIALVPVGFQAIRAAMTNPEKNLRNE